MPNPWRHTICPACYRLLEPGRRPVALLRGPPEFCCRCGQLTLEAIAYRADPGRFLCRGLHHRTGM